MSYILDALKKSDRSRQLNTTHSIQIPSDSSVVSKSRKWPLVLGLLGAVLILAVLAIQLGWFEKSSEPASKVIASGVGTTKVEQEMDDSALLIDEAPVVSLNEVAKSKSVTSVAVKPVEMAEAVVPTEKSMTKPAVEPSVMSSLPTGERRSLQSLVSDKKTEPSGVRSGMTTELVRQTPVDNPQANTRLNSRVTQTQDAEQASGAAQKIKYINYSSIRSSLRGLGEMHLDILAYHSKAEDRRAYINMKPYYEGEQTAEGGTISEIRADGVVMTYQGREFILTAQ